MNTVYIQPSHSCKGFRSTTRCPAKGHITVKDEYGSLCADVPPPSGKIGRGDVCESPTIIVFPFPRNVGDSL